MTLKAVIFDVDGTIAETERDGHRVAFNRAFAALGLEDRWDEELYGKLLKVAGGPERLRHYFEDCRSSGELDLDQLIPEIHKLKNRILLEIIKNSELQPRPGVVRIMDELHDAGIRIAVATTGSRIWVQPLLEELLGKKRASRIDPVVTGDDVTRKKPDPQTYEIALRRLAIDPEEAIAVEDSRNGLLAAHSAGIPCLFTPDSYTINDDAGEAVVSVSSLGDSNEPVKVLSNPHGISVGRVIDISVFKSVVQYIPA